MKRFIYLVKLLLSTLIAQGQQDSIAELRIRDWTYYSVSSRLYIPIQFAGNIGFISGGIGYRPLSDKYQLSLVYGYVPSSVSAVTSHLVTGKNIFHIYQFPVSKVRTFIPYAAVGISLEVKGRSFFTQPDIMPRGYYDFPKSIHAIPAIGMKLRHRNLKPRGFQSTEFFIEATSVDAYIWYRTCSDDVRFSQIISLALGVHLLSN